MLQIVLLFSFVFFSGSAFAVNSINISIEKLSHDQVDLSQVQMQMHLMATPSINIKTKLKQKNDQLWSEFNLNCQLPKRLNPETWHCPQGQFNAARIKVPYVLDLTPEPHGFSANIQVKKASFSDEIGLHAAEKLSANLRLKIKQAGENFRWENTLDWTNGEIFWQPFFLTGGGHQFISSGIYDGKSLKFEKASLAINKVGQLNFNGELQLNNQQITQLEAELPNLDVATAYPILFKPLLENTAFNHAEMAGNVALKLSIKDAEFKALDIQLKEVDIEDQNKKFAFYKVNADIPWRYDEARQINFSYLNGFLLNLPLGKTNIQAQVNRYAWTAPKITLPILDGALNLSDISAARIGSQWYWHLGATLTPINMENFSRALNLPIMAGHASAQIPQVTYSNGVLTTNGEMTFNVFDGKASVTNLSLINPLSNQPKLHADLSLRQLDLGNLTRTFSFGSIEGKLDGDINALIMDNWKPVQFDAILQNSPGKYSKKISQRAVENISALGGAGAAAAVQRSVLRFFEQFNYEKLSLSCKLRNNICKMDGLTSTQGGYIIVKGSGIPAITVMGFNRTVGWDDLLARIKRITDGNTKAIIK